MKLNIFQKTLLMVALLFSLEACASRSPQKFVAIKSNPEELDYAKYTCEAEAKAVGNRVSSSIKAATPDIQGGGFAGGFANGMQGNFEGLSARKDHFKACMARAGYRID